MTLLTKVGEWKFDPETGIAEVCFYPEPVADLIRHLRQTADDMEREYEPASGVVQ